LKPWESTDFQAPATIVSISSSVKFEVKRKRPTIYIDDFGLDAIRKSKKNILNVDPAKFAWNYKPTSLIFTVRCAKPATGTDTPAEEFWFWIVGGTPKHWFTFISQFHFWSISFELDELTTKALNAFPSRELWESLGKGLTEQLKPSAFLRDVEKQSTAEFQAKAEAELSYPTTKSTVAPVTYHADSYLFIYDGRNLKPNREISPRTFNPRDIEDNGQVAVEVTISTYDKPPKRPENFLFHLKGICVLAHTPSVPRRQFGDANVTVGQRSLISDWS
jgi:hypothetical protein